jgi:hypothetical protein
LQRGEHQKQGVRNRTLQEHLLVGGSMVLRHFRADRVSNVVVRDTD